MPNHSVTADKNSAGDDPNILVCGISHRELASHKLAPFIIAADDRPPLRKALLEQTGQTAIGEAVLLVTCNRCEIYVAGYDAEKFSPSDFARQFVSLIVEPTSEDDQGYMNSLYLRSNFDAVTHLLRVACGGESMIPGESQILGQVRTAYLDSQTHKHLGSDLTHLFNFVLNSAKNIRSKTNINAHSSSFAAAAIRLITHVFKNPREQNVLFVGTGEMTELNVRQFSARSFNHLTLTGRSPDKVKKLASLVSAPALKMSLEMSEALSRLHEYDVVVTCTASETPIIQHEHVANAIAKRNNRSLCLIDMALPRDIDPSVVNLDDVYLFNLDDLGSVAREMQDAHKASLREVDDEIEKSVNDYRMQLESAAADTYIKMWRASAEDINRDAIAKAHKQLNAGDKPENVVEDLSGQLTNKLLHPVTELIRRIVLDGGGESLKRLEDILKNKNKDSK